MKNLRKNDKNVQNNKYIRGNINLEDHTTNVIAFIAVRLTEYT